MRITKKVVSLVLAILMVTTMMSVMAVSTAFAVEATEINLSGSDTITISTGGTYKITGTTTATPAVAISTTEPVVIVDSNFATTSSNASATALRITVLSGDITVQDSTITTKMRGINMTTKATAADTSNLTITIDNTKILNSRVSDYENNAYTAGDARGINLLNADYNVTVNNSEIKGFKYSINEPGCNSERAHTVTVTNSTIYGWGILNSYSLGGTYEFKNCDIRTINKTSASAWNSFAAFTFDTDGSIVSENNTLTIDNCTVEAVFGDGDADGYPRQSMFKSNGINNTFVVKGEDTVVNIDEDRGDLVLYNNLTDQVNGNKVEIQGGAFDCAIVAYPVADYEISGGTFNNEVLSLSDVEISGGTFNDAVVTYSPETYDSALNISGGTFNGVVDTTASDNADANITISGGTFSDDVPVEFLDNTVESIDKGDGTYTVEPTSEAYVARVGSDRYTTLQAALNAAPSGSTVTLLTDINEPTASYKQNRTYGIEGKSSLTVDGNGHTVTISNPSAKRGFGIWYDDLTDDGAEITFKDITIYNYTDDSRAIDTRGKNIKSLTLDNVTMDCPSSAQYSQTLTIGGSQAKPLELNIINGSKIISRNYYAIITFNPVNATITNSTIDGWACIYAKGPDGSVGSDGSVYNITDSVLRSACVHGYGHDNNFSMITMHDCSNVEVNITNTEIYLEGGNNIQSLVNSGDFAHSYDITGNEVKFGAGNTVNLADENAIFTIDEEGLDFDISGGTFTKEVPVELCAEDYYPVTDGSGNYTVDSLTDSDANITVNGGHFGLGESVAINDGAILGVQLKGYNNEEAETSQSHQENGRDMRFVAAVDTDLLKAAEDYGFVLAKADDTKGSDDRTAYNTNFNGLGYNGGNGEKTLSAVGTFNNLAGENYGKLDSSTATDYKFVTCAVNSVETGKKIVARFFVKVNGKVYYMNYTNDQNDTFTGCVAGINGSYEIY